MAKAFGVTRITRDELPKGQSLCEYCTAKCCRYFAMPIETPDTFKELEYLRWFLLHDRASVFKEDDDWYLLVHTTCKHLQPDNRCGACSGGANGSMVLGFGVEGNGQTIWMQVLDDQGQVIAGSGGSLVGGEAPLLVQLNGLAAGTYSVVQRFTMDTCSP
jgi:hypothetical protein